jgi:hypothetical protein
MKMNYVNTETFKDCEVEIEDFLYTLADNIRHYVYKEYEYQHELGTTTQLLATDKGDENKVGFGLLTNRKVGETSNRYRITIERLPE